MSFWLSRVEVPGKWHVTQCVSLLSGIVLYAIIFSPPAHLLRHRKCRLTYQAYISYLSVRRDRDLALEGFHCLRNRVKLEDIDVYSAASVSGHLIDATQA